MPNLTTTTSSSSTSIIGGTVSSNTSGTWPGGFPCVTHGWMNCNCNNNSLNTMPMCFSCGQYYNSNILHTCSGSGTGSGINLCGLCGQSFSPMAGHACPAYGGLHSGVNYTGTWRVGPTLREVKEITTDIELTYEWNGGSFDMSLPEKFSDCFLKVGFTWSPLYPLIFSALENDQTTISFHLVREIMDKVSVGNKVVLKSVTTTKIEDNLTLIQLVKQIRSFFDVEK